MTPFSGRNRVTSPYGWRTINGVKEFHYGEDIVGDDNQTIRAIWDSIKCEVSIGYNGGRGNMVILYYNNNLRVINQRMNTVYVKNGQAVKQGVHIGTMGNTGYSFGAHLHIEVQILQNGRWTPVEPSQYTEVPNTVGTHPGNNNYDKDPKPEPPPQPTPEPPLYMLTIGPASEGDKNTLEAQATLLGIPVVVTKK